MKKALVVIILILSGYINAQVQAYAPKRKFHALLHYSFDLAKSDTLKFILVNQKQIRYSLENDDYVQKMRGYLSFLRENETRIKVFDFKGRLFEECSLGTFGTLTGEYRFYFKNGKVHSKGKYDKYGKPIGIWLYYNKKGKLKYKILEDGTKVRC